MSLNGVTEIFLKTGEPGAGILPDAGYIFTWYEDVSGDKVLKYKDQSGAIDFVGTSGPVGGMFLDGLVSETGNVTLPNTTTFTTVYTDSITVNADGNLFIDVSIAIKPHASNNDYKFRVLFDGVALDPDLIEEGKDVSSVQSHWRSQTLVPLGAFVAGNYDLELQFAKETTGGTAELKNYTAKVVRY